MHLPANANSLTKQPADHRHLLPYESLLAEGLRGFLSELTMINGAVLISYICNEQHSILSDLLQSSAEREIKPDILHYANEAAIEFDWGEAPSVALSMEFQAADLTVFFRVVMAGDHVGIDIRGIHFNDDLGRCEDNLRRFAAAIRDARLDSAALGADRAA